MHNWYEAVCYFHKERCPVFMTVGVDSKIEMPYSEDDASDFLNRHYGCELHLVWRDDQLDIENERGCYRKDSPFRKN